MKKFATRKLQYFVIYLLDMKALNKNARLQSSRIAVIRWSPGTAILCAFERESNKPRRAGQSGD